ncbi:helical backbone metal receptor [Jatrophihabitans telluris]|uniref:Helical backbone metal receptor n=1 Tax=Jatrophihabitans telluris TaxID=2038343 RepID=A0ABY4R1S9_9ACTN|nr:helical backbone metal receptor [Jatrophihabitans telluris]UQX89780.1 helical backbone metal receptor [Jatrophihabitans telluris]
MPAPSDDLGHPLSHPSQGRQVRRVVSLVPSLTEAIASTAPEVLVGATDWCTQPAGLDVTRIRGTKNPDLARIAGLRPDLVIANQEENRELDVRRMRAQGLDVWVTAIESIDEAMASLARLFTIALQRPEPTWLPEARAEWRGPDTDPWVRVAVPIWRDPWMVVGPRTFTSSLLTRLGARNVFDQETDPAEASSGRGSARYPQVEHSAVRAGGAEVVLLPDEPYPFSASDGPEAFAGLPAALIDGRCLTWYGPSLLGARERIVDILARALAH